MLRVVVGERRRIESKTPELLGLVTDERYVYQANLRGWWRGGSQIPIGKAVYKKPAEPPRYRRSIFHKPKPPAVEQYVAGACCNLSFQELVDQILWIYYESLHECNPDRNVVYGVLALGCVG